MPVYFRDIYLADGSFLRPESGNGGTTTFRQYTSQGAPTDIKLSGRTPEMAIANYKLGIDPRKRANGNVVGSKINSTLDHDYYYDDDYDDDDDE